MNEIYKEKKIKQVSPAASPVMFNKVNSLCFIRLRKPKSEIFLNIKNNFLMHD